MQRRKFMATGGALVAGAAFGPARAFSLSNDEAVMPSKLCSATTRITRGPYLTPNSPLRSDIREDRAGVPLRLTLKIQNDFWCQPIEGAAVDIWHCDASGLYSNVNNVQFDYQTLQLSGSAIDMRGTSFLRGHQVTNAAGVVEFLTVFPGWYMGRLPHLHVKTTINGVEWTTHDTQLFLPTDIERAVYETPPYAERGQNPLSADRDLVAKGDASLVQAMTVPLTRDGDGYKGVFEIAMAAL
ncbi:MAG: catechol 1,2-dioxygenase [Parvularculaceae bacterium]